MLDLAVQGDPLKGAQGLDLALLGLLGHPQNLGDLALGDGVALEDHLEGHLLVRPAKVSLTGGKSLVGALGDEVRAEEQTDAHREVRAAEDALDLDGVVERALVVVVVVLSVLPGVEEPLIGSELRLLGLLHLCLKVGHALIRAHLVQTALLLQDGLVVAQHLVGEDSALALGLEGLPELCLARRHRGLDVLKEQVGVGLDELLLALRAGLLLGALQLQDSVAVVTEEALVLEALEELCLLRVKHLAAEVGGAGHVGC